MNEPKVSWPYGESIAYRALWAKHVDVCGERTILRLALLRLVEAERRFTKDTGILLNDAVSDACAEAEKILASSDATDRDGGSNG